MNKLITRLNHIWKNLFLDVFLFLSAFVVFIISFSTRKFLDKDFNAYDNVLGIIAILFLLHMLLYFFLFIFNLLHKAYIKSVICLVLSLGGLYLLFFLFGFFLALRGGAPSDDYDVTSELKVYPGVTYTTSLLH